jgi:hypothetical protein
MYVVCQFTGNMSCFKSNQTLYECDATVLVKVYIYLMFVGEGYLALTFATPETIVFEEL